MKMKKMASKSSSKIKVFVKDIVISLFYPLIKDNEHMHIILTSGRAGTKSSFMAILAIITIILPHKASVVVLRKHHNKLNKTVYKECLRAINRLHLKKRKFKITKSPMQITYLKTGNSIFFTGSDSIDDTKGIIDEDRPISLVILDELTEFFEKGEGEDEIEHIKATFVRGNNSTFRMLYLFNPPRNPKSPVMQWVKKMEQREDVIHIHSTYKDVPVAWLGQKLIDEAEAMKTADEKMYNWVWLGLCTGLDELIYYMFNEERHIIDHKVNILSNLKMLGVGIDYGQMNATTYQCFGIDFQNKKLVGVAEYYHSGRESGHQKSPSEYARDFKRFVEEIERKTYNIVSFAVIDPSAKGLAEEIKRVIPRIKLISADNTVIRGINRVQKLLSFFVIELDPSQKHAIDEFQLYEWDMDLVDKGKEVPVKTNDHCMDAIRYYVMYVWNYLRRLLPFLKEKDE